MSSSVPLQPSGSTRTGYVTLLGLPNAGKSTLLNRFVGEHLSIVTPRAQTTWSRITGLLTRESEQFVFLDTPGLLVPRDLLQRAMLATALEALQEADVLLLVVDASSRPERAGLLRLEALLPGSGAPLHVALNQVDRASPESLASWSSWAGGLPRARAHPVSALLGTGADALLDAIGADLPPGPFLYPPDEIATQPVRFFAAELVRESVFELYHQEIPYSVVCRVEEFREEQEPAYILVHVFVERPSQKGILLGKGGAAVKELGRSARAKIEHFLGRRVYLDLWVKPLKSWRRSRPRLGELGFRVPEDD